MKIVYFTHSLLSCWNHGNAHFLRGVLRELVRRGHEVAAFEPTEGWSLQNLLRDHGPEAHAAFHAVYGELRSSPIESPLGAEAACDGADLVIAHEWNDPALIAELGRLRRRSGFTLLFHDTHHRAVSAPDELQRYELQDFDGVLAFGESLAEAYRRMGWGRHVFVWHEAADTTVFVPPAVEQVRSGIVWIGNWGDGERSAELQEYLLRPTQSAGLPLEVYGVRYPDEALEALRTAGARYHGWSPNVAAPGIFARHLATVHVPRRFYVDQLPGIPTIRVFEALACGIPLVCAPWRDSEGLFRPGRDFLMVRDGEAMRRSLLALRGDEALCQSLVDSGLETIRTRHSCAHRVDELLRIVAGLRAAKDHRMTEDA